MEASTLRVIVGRLSRLGVSGGTSPSGDATAMGVLEMELALLREENARLNVERHRPTDVGRVIERMRNLGLAFPAERRGEGGSEDREDAHAMLECLAVRDGLVEACHEVQRAMQAMRSQLCGLSLDVQDGARDRAMVAPAVLLVADEVDLELAARTRASPNGTLSGA
jgi:hypothetical protein